MNQEMLKIDYDQHKPNAQRFMSAIVEQLSDLVEKYEVTLGTQIESRVKSFQSIEEKILRKNRDIETVIDFSDYIGIRIIVLFKSDIEKMSDLIHKHFHVTDEEDVSNRLEEDQFGYQSTHYAIKLPSAWLQVPTLNGLDNYKAEVQVRTLSQHIWAVASHKLQYKHESNVPSPIKRSINRVSALLETVDLEFERVLVERKDYVHHIDEKNEFNVDVLKSIFDKFLPEVNRLSSGEPYSEIFDELIVNGIDSAGKLEELIKRFLPHQLEEDSYRVQEELNNPEEDDLGRLERGVFYTHVGLIRGCLHKLKGDDYIYVKAN